MWKFKASKYKNAAPKIPKKEEWLHVFVGNIMPSHGNHIKASAAFMAYNVASTGGGNLGVVPLEQKGRMRQDMPVIRAHSDFVTDMDFSPHDDLLLATASADCTVKLWTIPEGGLEDNLCNSTLEIASEDKKIEVVLWHPTAAGLVSIAFGKTVKLFDVNSGSSSELYSTSPFEDQLHSMSWKSDGSLLVTSCKDKMLRIIDPRNDNIAGEVQGHENVKDSRAVWMGNTNYILSCGFDMMRTREMVVRDTRNLQTSLAKVTTDSSTGSVMPLFDPDTNMFFVCGKGDTSIRYMEFSEKEPYLSDSGMDHVEQVRGLAIAPKRALDVMTGEVNRLLILGKDAIVTLPYIVPRKTYRDFHEDIFPDTSSCVPTMNAAGWFSGQNSQPSKISLNPAKNQVVKPLRMGDVSNMAAPVSTTPAKPKSSASQSKPPEPKPAPVDTSSSDKVQASRSVTSPSRLKPEVTSMFSSQTSEEEQTPTKSVTTPRRLKAEAISMFSKEDETPPSPIHKPKPAPLKSEVTSVFASTNNEQPVSSKSSGGSASPSTPPISEKSGSSELNTSPFGPRVSHAKKAFDTPAAAATPEQQQSPVMRRQKVNKVLPGVRQSKFRHWKGTTLHKQYHIENIRNLSKSVPGESNGFSANKDRCAVPLAGPGGRVAILELSNPGRLPDTGVPIIQNGSPVMDFMFDPFNNLCIVTGCDDALIRVWTLPEGGASIGDVLEEPSMVLHGHSEKIYFIRFHPLAKDVMASASFDMTVRIWDLKTGEEKIQLEGHTDTIFNLAWSPDGKKCATACKDGKLRIYEPRKSTLPIAEGPGPEGSRGARVEFVCDGSLLAVTGFDRMSSRTISIYDVNKVADGNLNCIDTGTSPAILIPYYDEDSSTLFVTAKGDGQVLAYEIDTEHPFLYPLSTFKAEGLHQAIAYLPKSEVNVKQVEFIRALRLTQHSVEPLSFTVPRVKTEFFQDDLFPDTKVTWQAVMTSSEWFNGLNKPPKKVSLKPRDMTPLSEAPVEAPKPKKYESHKILDEYKTDEQKKEELLSAMSGRLNLSSGPLPQDLTEGVDEDEWDD